ncbi:hypothetical protein AMTRI_Chr13g121200 [Amborella trichopoda]
MASFCLSSIHIWKPLPPPSPPSPHRNQPASPFLSITLIPSSSPSFSLTKARRRIAASVVCMAPEEERITRRSPLDFPIEWERPKPGRRPDIFPQFSPMKTPLPPPMPYDPPEEDEEEEEKKEGEDEEDPEKEETENPEGQ